MIKLAHVTNSSSHNDRNPAEVGGTLGFDLALLAYQAGCEKKQVAKSQLLHQVLFDYIWAYGNASGGNILVRASLFEHFEFLISRIDDVIHPSSLAGNLVASKVRDYCQSERIWVDQIFTAGHKKMKANGLTLKDDDGEEIVNPSWVQKRSHLLKQEVKNLVLSAYSSMPKTYPILWIDRRTAWKNREGYYRAKFVALI